jgi:hypothetical protein
MLYAFLERTTIQAWRSLAGLVQSLAGRKAVPGDLPRTTLLIVY